MAMHAFDGIGCSSITCVHQKQIVIHRIIHHHTICIMPQGKRWNLHEKTVLAQAFVSESAVGGFVPGPCQGLNFTGGHEFLEDLPSLLLQFQAGGFNPTTA
jgi:hypothetical protein